MPSPKIRVRNKTTGGIAEIAEQALAHFPDFERVDPVIPEAVFVEPPLPPVEEPTKTPRRSTAAKTTEEE